MIDHETGRLSPRASFAAWTETVRGQSAAWLESDLALVRELEDALAAESSSRTKTELAELRDYDPLTRLPNQKMLERKLSDASRSNRARGALLFIDLSETKQINVTLGYATGDALLVELARRLVATAGPGCMVARRGGAELVVLCEGLDNAALSEMTERIRQSMELPFAINGHHCQVSPIIRLAVSDQAGGSLIDALETLMLAAKNAVEVKRAADAQRQKMESLGRMTGGISHEISNLLQPITLLGQELLDNHVLSEAGAEYIGVIVDCSLKARQIIADLLAFSRPTARVVESLDPSLLLEDTLRLVKQAIPSSITLGLEIERDLPEVVINRTSFVQILMNLATNAAAAMAGNGLLTITLTKLTGETGELVSGRLSNFIEMRVTDVGRGMSKATLERAFEPFFTTKDVGQGTGLGLSVVFGLVDKMGGRITIASELDRGTTITVLLPSR